MAIWLDGEDTADHIPHTEGHGSPYVVLFFFLLFPGIATAHVHLVGPITRCFRIHHSIFMPSLLCQDLVFSWALRILARVSVMEFSVVKTNHIEGFATSKRAKIR